MNAFVRFEKWIESVIEKPFGYLFRPHLHPADLTKALVQAIERSRIPNGRGGYIAPNYYHIYISRADYQRWQIGRSQNGLVRDIKALLNDLITEMTGHPLADIQVEIGLQADLAAGQCQISAHHWVAPLPHRSPANAANLPHQTKPITTPPHSKAQQWQLIMEDRTIQLGMPVVRLGRAADNDVVLPDQSIAKYQAQLRWRHQQYHLQNLSRTHPIWLNNQPVKAPSPLHQGDQLKLGNFTVDVVITHER